MLHADYERSQLALRDTLVLHYMHFKHAPTEHPEDDGTVLDDMVSDIYGNLECWAVDASRQIVYLTPYYIHIAQIQTLEYVLLRSFRRGDFSKKNIGTENHIRLSQARTCIGKEFLSFHKDLKVSI